MSLMFIVRFCALLCLGGVLSGCATRPRQANGRSYPAAVFPPSKVLYPRLISPGA